LRKAAQLGSWNTKILKRFALCRWITNVREELWKATPQLKIGWVSAGAARRVIPLAELRASDPW